MKHPVSIFVPIKSTFVFMAEVAIPIIRKFLFFFPMVLFLLSMPCHALHVGYIYVCIYIYKFLICRRRRDVELPVRPVFVPRAMRVFIANSKQGPFHPVPSIVKMVVFVPSAFNLPMRFPRSIICGRPKKFKPICIVFVPQPEIFRDPSVTSRRKLVVE